MQYLGKYNSTLQKSKIVQKYNSPTAGIQGLASSDQARRVTDWRREDGRTEGSPATGDGGQAATSLMPDVDRTHIPIFESSKCDGLYVGNLLMLLL